MKAAIYLLLFMCLTVPQPLAQTTCGSPWGDFQFTCPSGLKMRKYSESVDLHPDKVIFRQANWTNDRGDFILNVRWYAPGEPHRLRDGALESYSGQEDFVRDTFDQYTFLSNNESFYNRKYEIMEPPHSIHMAAGNAIAFAVKSKPDPTRDFLTGKPKRGGADTVWIKLGNMLDPELWNRPEDLDGPRVASWLAPFADATYAFAVGAFDDQGFYVLTYVAQSAVARERAQDFNRMLASFAVNKVSAQPDSISPRERLKQSLATLQQQPWNDELREQIIKLALTLDPRPAAPPEMDESVGRATYTFKSATSESDFRAAADAYAKASNLAPWIADNYFNQGVALEKAKKFDEAIKAFQWYLMASPDSQEAREVRQRIGGLKAAAEKSQEQGRKDRDEQEKQQAIHDAFERFRAKFQGRTYYHWYCNHVRIPLKYGIPLEQLVEGCNLAETEGRNWYQWSPFTRGFRFNSDNTVEFYDITNNGVVYVGRFTGPKFRDVVWTAPGKPDTPIWANVSSDGQFVVFSPGRPANISEKDPRFDASARYTYEMWEVK